MTLTVLGCDGSYPGAGGASSGYLVSCDGTNVWLDAGSGTLANLQRFVELERLDAVVITHEHVDHWSDLQHLAVACYWIVKRDRVPVYVQPDLASMMRVGSALDVLDFRHIGPEQEIEIGAMRFSFSQTDHPVDTLAVRVDGGGRSLAYSADTGPGWDLAKLGTGIHLALCEATFLSDKEGALPHLSARQAGRMAKEAGVERLVITHLLPRTDRGAAAREAAKWFGAAVEVAAIGERYVA